MPQALCFVIFFGIFLTLPLVLALALAALFGAPSASAGRHGTTRRVTTFFADCATQPSQPTHPRAITGAEMSLNGSPIRTPTPNQKKITPTPLTVIYTDCRLQIALFVITRRAHRGKKKG